MLTIFVYFRTTGLHFLRVFEFSLFEIFEQMGIFGDVD